MCSFLTAGADANNLPTVKFTQRSKIRFVIVIAPKDSFKILTTLGCLFLSILFLAVAVSASSIVVPRATEGIAMGEASKGFLLTSSYSPNQTFLGVTYSLSFCIRRRNIHLTDSFAASLAGLGWFVRVAKTPILSIGVFKETYSIFLSEE